MSTGRHYPIPQGCSLKTQALEMSQGEGGQDLAPLARSARAGRHTRVQWQVASLNVVVAPSQMLCRMCCYFNRTHQHSFWHSVCGLLSGNCFLLSNHHWGRLRTVCPEIVRTAAHIPCLAPELCYFACCLS